MMPHIDPVLVNLLVQVLVSFYFSFNPVAADFFFSIFL
jgi:hypothetical protein